MSIEDDVHNLQRQIERLRDAVRRDRDSIPDSKRYARILEDMFEQSRRLRQLRCKTRLEKQIEMVESALQRQSDPQLKLLQQQLNKGLELTASQEVFVGRFR